MTNVLALPTGTELVGDFRIEHVLGAGGFGMTYLAEETALARKVTIKEYFPTDFAARHTDLSAVPRNPETAEDFQWGLDRFIDEAQTLARFDHPNIVRVYRYFKANGTAYMVLSFEEGESLKAWLKRLGRAPRQREIDDMLGPLLDALEVVHAACYLHRDIAPDNIMIRRDGTPVLIDFGSARGEIAARSCTVSALVKPGYSPYEQYAENGARQGPWTDIYALGATLYHAICGRRPPDAPSRVVKDELGPAREMALAAYRPRFLAAVDRALILDPGSRPQSIKAWRGDLLAPEASKPSWLQRATGRANPEAGHAPGRTRTVLLTQQPGVAPPPPDAPGSPGQMLDYIEGLKQEAAPATPDILAQGPSRTLAPMPLPPQAARSGGTGELAPEPAVRSASRPSHPSRARSAADDAPSAARKPTGSIPTPEAARARPPRPRPMRSGGRHWRGFAVRFLIGAGIAGAAIYHQERLSAFLSPTPEGGAASVARAPSSNIVTGSNIRGTESGTQVTTATAAFARAPAVDPLRVTMLPGHRGGAIAVGFTGDGTMVVTAGADGTLRAWNASTGTNVRTITLPEGAATSMAVLGRRALTGHADGRVALWDVDSGQRLATFRRGEAGITSVGFGRDGSRVIASSTDAMVAVWDIAVPTTPVASVEAHDGAVTAVAYAERGPFIVTGGEDSAVRLWRAGDLTLVRSFRGHREAISAVAFSPDGRHLAAAAGDGRIRVWNTSSASLYRLNSQHRDRVRGLAFSPSGDIVASAAEDGTVQLWQLRQSRVVRATAEVAMPARGLAFTPDGSRAAVASADGSVRFWDAAPPTRRER
jgi:WD40 repeat protein/serine/threonine protein kinase